MTDKLTVFEAWTKVMGDVQAIRKSERNTHQNFNFRGIDAVLNAVGPALRKHGVVVVPTDVFHAVRDVETTTGKAAREATVVATYTVYGPGGDSFTMMAPGESLDHGDKSTPKAMSVALRTALLQGLCIPTDEPDPDSQTYERAPKSDLTAAKKKLWSIVSANDPDINPAEVLDMLTQEGIAHDDADAISKFADKVK